MRKQFCRNAFFGPFPRFNKLMKNHNHDLVQQLSEDLDSLWRYKTYLRNAKGCAACTAMWKNFVKMDEEKARMLRDEISRHVRERRFD